MVMIDKTAKIGRNVRIGEYVVIEKNVVIGDDVVIGHHAVIKEDTIIGNHVIIDDLVSLGHRPSSNKKMARKPLPDLAPLVISNYVKVGSNCVDYCVSLIYEVVFIGYLVRILDMLKVG